jgi:transposase
VFADESGFYLLPFACRTYAPKGETPVLRHKLSREHLSAISGITMKGKLYIQVREKSFKGPDVVNFLKHLLKYISGKILVIWDGASIHRSKDIKKFLAEGGSKRIQLESLPAYSPDLNPDEGVWQYLKCVCLKNICCQDLKQLKKALQKAIRTLRSRKHIIMGCFKRMEYV